MAKRVYLDKDGKQVEPTHLEAHGDKYLMGAGGLAAGSLAVVGYQAITDKGEEVAAALADGAMGVMTDALADDLTDGLFGAEGIDLL